ncbi:MAG: 3'-5' exonuclease [Synechococcus sp. SP1 MAG]|nr:3'-5' exonuclease [Synechococcus sp. SP1 MAG]
MADQLDLLGGLQPTVRASAPESNPRASAPTPQLEDSQPEESDSRAASPPSVVPRTLLILDTETTGLGPETHHCVEVGAILFDVQSRAVLAQQSFLLPAETNAAEPINRIPAAVTRLPQPWKEGLRWFQNLLDAADVLVAHNAAFDRQWFGRGELPAVTQPWLCSMDDMRWPADRQLRSRPSVRDLALAYGVPVWAAHRALTDCIYLAEVFARCEDLEQQLLQGLEPRQLVRAKVSYDDRQLARDAGFRWNDPIKGAWARRMSEREIQELSFPVAPVDLEAGDSKT